MRRFVSKARMHAVLQAVVLLSLVTLPVDGRAITPQEARDVTALNVTIAVFDPGVPEDLSLHRDLDIFPRIREIEAMFLPFVLRETLARSNDWGAVRVVPQLDPAAELLVSGLIVRSDGEVLELRVRAVDASGRVWFDEVFAGAVTDKFATRDVEYDMPGYQALYDEVAARLRSAREQLSDKELNDVAELSLLRYANELAPSAFGGYLRATGEGRFVIERLPAENDPMLERIKRLRSTEYVITDAVDAKYRELNVEIASIYDLWRQYRRKGVQYESQNAARAQKEPDAPRGSYEAIQDLYDNYKWDRITAQEQDRLAVAFDNEVGPKVTALELRVAELEGWVGNKYAEWHRLLEALFEAETGLQQ